MPILIKTINGLPYGSVKTWNGLPVASIKTIKGLDVTAGGAFSPTDISGLKLWLQGDNAPSGSIASWQDDSGNGYHATETTDKPTKVAGAINGHAAVSFTGAARLDSSAPWSSALTIFFVAKILTTPPYTGIDEVCAAISTPVYGEVCLTNTFASTSQTFFGGFSDLYLNGSAASSPPANYPASSYAVGVAKRSSGSTDSGLRIGHETGGAVGYASNVEIAEFIMYDSDLSTGNRESVEDYLGAKYGITIA